MTRIVVLLALFVVLVPVVAAGPAPESVSFQGVLRDAADNPLDGDYDMTFRLFDVPFGGTELYFDTHDAAGLGAVSVSQGLFTVAIGTGIHSNASLANVFRDHIELYVEIEVGGETLSPRVAIHSAGHALNASNAESAVSCTTAGSAGDAGLLDGLDSSQFLRSDQDGVTSGALTAGELRSNGDLYLNRDGPDGDARIYFHDSLSDPWFGWNDSNGRLTANGWLEVSGGTLLVDGNLYVGRGSGGSSFSRIEFGEAFQNGFLEWSESIRRFILSDTLLALGEIQTQAQQIVINSDGPNENQDIEFYNGGPQLERFQWDATALRFEVSDDFHAFGALSADVKNFVQNHPYRDDLEIVYTSLEGNEVTTFTRGSGRLVNGEARIELEESFRYVTNPDIGLSAHLTPRGPSSGLYTASVSTSELEVRSVDGDDVAFDFVVYGLRIGYEDHPVYRAKRSESFVPLPDRYQAELSAAPDLADHTALARYRRMSGEAFDAVDRDMPRAWALREAIGMRELNVDYPRGSEISVRDMNRAAALSGERRVGPDPALASEPSPATPSVSGLRRDAEGNVYARSFRPSAGDIASLVPVGEPVEAGDVLVIDPLEPGSMRLARSVGNTAVFGVVAAEPGVVLGAKGPENADATGGEVPVAVSGVVLCKVDATFGEIRPGDLLQTSPNPGHAMRADDPRTGSVLGKALEPLDAGAGTIRVLVTLR